jgi:hypothetical protein
LAVLQGERRFERDDYTDRRLRAVAYAAEGFRAVGAAPTPERLASLLDLRGFASRGCQRWIAELVDGGRGWDRLIVASSAAARAARVRS